MGARQIKMKLDIMARSANNFVKIFLRRLSDDSEVAILIPPYLLVRKKQWANLPTLFADHGCVHSWVGSANTN